MTAEDRFEGSDQAAYEWCVQLLEEDPTAEYKHARKQARKEAGIGVRRQVWTAARRALGLASEHEASPPQEAPRPAPPTASPPPAARRPSPPPPPPAPPRERDERPDRREPDAPERRPDRPRPAWATPREALRPREAADPLVSPRPHAPAPPSPRESRPQNAPPPWATPRSPPPASRQPSSMEALTPPREPAGSNPTSAIEWMVGYLKTVNPEASFAEVRKAAEAAGHTVYPATFGRAQAITGILEDQEQKEKQQATPPPAAPGAASSRGAAETSRTSTDGPVDPIEGLQAFVDALNAAERDSLAFKKSMRAMLEVIEQALEA